MLGILAMEILAGCGAGDLGGVVVAYGLAGVGRAPAKAVS